MRVRKLKIKETGITFVGLRRRCTNNLNLVTNYI